MSRESVFDKAWLLLMSSVAYCGFLQAGDPKDVVEVTDSNFEEEVLEHDGMVLVEFYAPWCGHCKNLAPHWAQAATELKGKVKLCALDATVNTVMSNRYGVSGHISSSLIHLLFFKP